MKGKKGSVLHKILIHIIIIGMLFVIFLSAMDAKVGSRGVKQQVLEKELALLIDASDAGSSFEVQKKNPSGLVDSVRVSEGMIFVGVDGLPSSRGYPYFSAYGVEVEEDEFKFVVKVG